MFCQIANGSIAVTPVYEDEFVFAFDDISPQAPVHTLIVPKAHHSGIGDAVPAELMAALFCAVPEVAARKGVAESGYRVIVNNGRDARQSVDHLHVHVLGGVAMSHHMVEQG